MKKNIYFFIGVGALVLSALILLSVWYKKQQPTPGLYQSDNPIQTSNSAASSNDQETLEKLSLENPDAASLGPAMAKARMIEFLDPECESCKIMHPIVKRVLSSYEGKVFYQVRYMPFHGNSRRAMALLEAARLQGKYFEALDKLFTHQSEWGDHHSPRPELMNKYMAELGLNMAKLEKDSQDLRIKARIDKDQAEGTRLGVNGTPTFFVNGVFVDTLSEGALREALDAALR